jgi:AraC-like DNA-binding protein
MSESILYREIEPSAAIAPFVRCLWHLSGPANAAYDAQPIVPDGCVEIVLNLGDPFVRVNGETRVQPAAMFVGQHTGPVVVIPTGAIDVWGVRLHPWGAAGFLATPLGELRESTVQLEDVLGKQANICGELQDHRSEASAERVLIAALERWLGGRNPPERGVRAAVELITRTGILPSVRSMGAQLGRSTRWIQRTFRETVGLTPKMLSRISRVQRAMRLATSRRTRTWSSIAADVGYFDQSHLVRDFRQIVGCTPSTFAARDQAITAAFIEPNGSIPTAPIA